MIPIPKNNLAKSTLAVIEAIAANKFEELTGYVNIQSLGCVGNVDTAKILTKYIASQPQNTVVSLFAPVGEYYFQSPLTVIDRVLHFKGAGRGYKRTVINVTPGVDGFWLHRRRGILSPNMLDDFTMVSTHNENTPKATGIKIWHESKVRNVQIEGFSDNGVLIDGYLGGDPDLDADHNASFSKVYDCYISANGGNGIEIQGRDGNACVTFANDIRNNGGWGIWDSSLLGGTHMAWMLHTNKTGPLHVDGDVNRSSFFGGYIENDHGPSVFPNEYSQVFGGYSEAGNKGGKIL